MPGATTTRQLLQRRHHRVSLDEEMDDALNSLGGSSSAQAASVLVTVAQSPSLTVLVAAVAHAGPLLENLDGPGALSELRVARGYTGDPLHLAALGVGSLALLPRGFRAEGLDELAGDFALEIVQRPCARILPETDSTEGTQRRSGLSRRYVNRRGESLEYVFGTCCASSCRFFAVWKRTRTSDSLSTPAHRTPPSVNLILSWSPLGNPWLVSQ